MNLTRIAPIVLCLFAASCSNDSGSPPSPAATATAPEPSTPAIVRPGRPGPGETAPADMPMLNTQVFERGDAQMSDMHALALENFLMDLRVRRDHDLSSNNNRPGPDGPYLTGWIDRVMSELQRRGYTTDAEGNIYRPNKAQLDLR